MNIWVSGVTGFLGRHVAAEVVKRGHVLVRRELNLLDLPPNAADVLPPIDAVIHCAAICRWSREPHADARFAKNVEMAKALRALVNERVPVVVPLPHGAIAPWNAYSSAASQCATFWEKQNGRLVYLPTLYGEGDPHHAKALPSFMLCAAGRGESRMVVYGGGVAKRQFMHVEAAAGWLVAIAQAKEAQSSSMFAGEEWTIGALAEAVRRAAKASGREMEEPEMRSWQYRADGLGSPTPERIYSDEAPTGRSPGDLERWIDMTVKRKNDELRAEKDQERAKEKAWRDLSIAEKIALFQPDPIRPPNLAAFECKSCAAMGLHVPAVIVEGIMQEFCKEHLRRGLRSSEDPSSW